MKGCHRCEHGEAVARGEYAQAAWEDVPCSSCDVMSSLGFAVEYDDARGSVGGGQLAVGSGEVGVVAGGELSHALPVAVMREVMVGFLKLRPELRDVIAWRFAGMSYRDIGTVQGVTMACAEKRHRRAMELWPALKALFPEKVAKRERRRTGCRGRTKNGEHVYGG